MHVLQQPTGVLIEGGGTAAPYLLKCGTDVKHLPGAEIEHPKDLIDVFRQLPESFFTLQIGDIDVRPDIASKDASRTEMRHAAAQNRPVFPVRPSQPALQLHVPACVE